MAPLLISVPCVCVRPRDLVRRREDLVDDGFYASSDDAEILGPVEELVRVLQRENGVLPAVEDAGGEEGLELGDEVGGVDGLRHPQKLGRAECGDEVVGAEVDGDAVAVLGA